MADLKLPRLNKAFIAGRITHDLELKYTPSGKAVLRFNVAVDRNYKDESDQWQKSTSFIDVVAWTYLAENLSNKARKGSAVLVEGRIETRTYVDSNNVNRKSFEIIADSVQTLELQDRTAEVPNEEPPLPPEPDEKPADDATNDDVPF